jgi:hypothetical protein
MTSVPLSRGGFGQTCGSYGCNRKNPPRNNQESQPGNQSRSNAKPAGILLAISRPLRPRGRTNRESPKPCQALDFPPPPRKGTRDERKCASKELFSRPCGANFAARTAPAVETAGYCRSSLWDRNERCQRRWICLSRKHEVSLLVGQCRQNLPRFQFRAKGRPRPRPGELARQPFW